jgi:tight adherence protein B
MSMPMMLIFSSLFVSATLIGWAILISTQSAWVRYSRKFTETAEGNLQSLFLFADAKKLFTAYIVTVLLVPLLIFLVSQSFPVAVIAFILLIASPRIVFKRLAEQRRKKINNALPDGLSQIAGAMRAGSTFTTAIQSMVEENNGPLGQEFSLLLREQRLGARLEEALDNLGERVQSEEMDLVISAALISQDVGGNLSEILASLSNTIRRKLEMEGKIKALTAQGVLQGRVVTLLPFSILFVLYFIEPVAIRPIFTSVLGWIFLAVILFLQIVGGYLIGKIVRIEI